jgi:hypothetical protein
MFEMLISTRCGGGLEVTARPSLNGLLVESRKPRDFGCFVLFANKGVKRKTYSIK